MQELTNTITIIGAGSVGSTCAYTLMMQNIVKEIILVDIDHLKLEGEVLDLSDAKNFTRTSSIRMGTLQDAKNSKIIVLTAGVKQKPGQTRLELVDKNKQLLTSILSELKPINPKSILLLVANPVDILTFQAQKLSGLPNNQVIGSGTLLDTQRLRGLLSKKLNISPSSVHVNIYGEHGDSQFPAWSSATISGIPIQKFPELTQNDLEELEKEVREKAQRIIERKGATYYGIASCVAEICSDIIYNRKRVLALSAYCEKEGICLSMPVILGESGIEKIVPFNFNEKENELFQKTSKNLRAVLLKN